MEDDDPRQFGEEEVIFDGSVEEDATIEMSVSEQDVFALGLEKEKIRQENELLVDWVCKLLEDRIKKIIGTRMCCPRGDTSPIEYVDVPNHIPLDEVVEAIVLPEYKKSSNAFVDITNINLDPLVRTQLKEYVTFIASAYRDNPFHNFEHACHVTMSVNKLLSRIVTPDLDIELLDNSNGYTYDGKDLPYYLYDYTNGINSDPITMFAIIVSAVIHDLDHRGISNTQLMKEETNLASLYRNKSVAEQNSFDIAWSFLMSDAFETLRNCIFTTMEEIQRFRQVLVNGVRFHMFCTTLWSVVLLILTVSNSIGE
jgi:3'5'-cyclic nucleotide phosphodiesterase